MDQNLDSSDFVEVDPTGRYGRYNEILGKGASKIVYRAFDEYEGIEVAWNQVKLNDFLQSPDDLERLYCEIHLLKTLKHKNIMKFYTSWVDASNRNINFVTEMFTSGTLRQYRQKHRTVNMRAIKHWCKQILEGLLYLHSLHPPVIHRDLKCDNIFINGNQGVVKIGDLGLAAILRKSYVDHCVGTPEFMAPEVYKEEYNELVDIYSFGMCVLEMVTLEYPYSECTHPAQIYKKVVSGIKPEALNRIKDPEVRQFIEECLAIASERPSASELLNHRFLQIDDSDDDDHDFDGVSETSHEFFSTKENDYCSSHDSHQDRFVENNGWDSDAHDLTIHGINLFDSHEDDPIANVGITIKGRRRDGGIFLRLRITDNYGHARNIHFPFDTKTDTALSVATEMVSELDIHDYEVVEIANMIDNEVSSLVPEWVPGSYILETSRFPHISVCGNCKSTVSSEGSVLDLISKTTRCYECAMHGRFEEITYQEGASRFSTSKSDEDCDEHGNVSRCDMEFDKELNWIMAKYKIEQRKLKNKNSGKKAKVMHSSPDLRNCRLENDFQASSDDDHRFFTAKQFYCLGDLLPNCIARTKSFPDYAVDV